MKILLKMVEIQVRIVLKILLSMLKMVEIQVRIVLEILLFMSMLKMGAFEGAAGIGCL